MFPSQGLDFGFGESEDFLSHDMEKGKEIYQDSELIFDFNQSDHIGERSPGICVYCCDEMHDIWSRMRGLSFDVLLAQIRNLDRAAFIKKVTERALEDKKHGGKFREMAWKKGLSDIESHARHMKHNQICRIGLELSKGRRHAVTSLVSEDGLRCLFFDPNYGLLLIKRPTRSLLGKRVRYRDMERLCEYLYDKEADHFSGGLGIQRERQRR